MMQQSFNSILNSLMATRSLGEFVKTQRAEQTRTQNLTEEREKERKRLLGIAKERNLDPGTTPSGLADLEDASLEELRTLVDREESIDVFADILEGGVFDPATATEAQRRVIDVGSQLTNPDDEDSETRLESAASLLRRWESQQATAQSRAETDERARRNAEGGNQ